MLHIKEDRQYTVGIVVTDKDKTPIFCGQSHMSKDLWEPTKEFTGHWSSNQLWTYVIHGLWGGWAWESKCNMSTGGDEFPFCGTHMQRSAKQCEAARPNVLSALKKCLFWEHELNQSSQILMPCQESLTWSVDTSKATSVVDSGKVLITPQSPQFYIWWCGSDHGLAWNCMVGFQGLANLIVSLTRLNIWRWCLSVSC